MTGKPDVSPPRVSSALYAGTLKRAQARLRADKRRQAEALHDGQSRILEMVATQATLTEVLTNLVLLIEAQSEGMWCSILLLDEDGVHLHHGAAPNLPPAYIQAVDGSVIGPQAGSCGTAAYRQEPVIVTDIHTDPLWDDYRFLVEPHGYRACWSTPIFSHRGQVLGTFAMYHREARGPSPLETRLIPIATHIARIAIESKHAEKALRESEQRYHGLFEDAPISFWEEDFSLVKRRLAALRQSGVTDFEAFFEHHPEVVAECAQLIRVLDVNRTTLKLYRATTKPELLADIGRVLGPMGMAAWRTELIHIAEGRTEFQWEGTNCALDGEPLYINLHWAARPGYEESLARVMVSIIDITERRQHEREQEVIVTVSAALRTVRNRAEMLPVILDQLLALLKADGTAIAIRDLHSGEIVFELARGALTGSTGLRLVAGEGVTGYVIASGQPYRNSTIRTDPLFARPDLLGSIQAVACVPLIAQGQTIGALLVGRQTEITEQEVRLLTSVGNITANAIQRTTLHEQTERRLRQLVALSDIDRAITSSVDLHVSLTTLLIHVLAQLGVDAADVVLFNAQLQTLEFVVGRGFRSPAVERAQRLLNVSHAGRAAQERQLVHIFDLRTQPDDFALTSRLMGEDFISYYGVPLLAKGQVKGVLEIFQRSPLKPDAEWLNFLHALAGQGAIAIDNATLFDSLQRSNLELAQAYDATIEGWSRALDLRDKETEGHTLRVTELTVQLAQLFSLNEAELVQVRWGALLHDIGKMGVPDSILLKPGPLTPDEWVLMKKHPTLAYEMLLPIRHLRNALDIPYSHHEKWDGTGYPQGLKGEQIPLTARIFAVVDVWDALSSDRPYRAAWHSDKVRAHIEALSGSHFDPQVVKVCLESGILANHNHV